MGSRWSVYFFGWCRLLLHHSGGVCVRGGVSMAGYFKKLMARHQDHPRKKTKKSEKYRMRGTLRSSIANRSITKKCVPKRGADENKQDFRLQ